MSSFDALPDDHGAILEAILPLVHRASLLVREAYERGDVRVDYKSPGDPVTQADRDANELLCEGLAALYPGAAVIGEESIERARGDRATAAHAFFVDPLDGTRDFVERTGQFAVMVGLAIDGRAALGVVKEPVTGRTYLGAVGLGAFEIVEGGAKKPLKVSTHHSMQGANLVLSRTRTTSRILGLAEHMGMTPSRVGSAGVKGARVAAGEADAFIHLGTSGYLWDSCAVDALVHAAGGAFTDQWGEPIDYRKPSLENAEGIVATNGHFHDRVVDAIQQLLRREAEAAS